MDDIQKRINHIEYEEIKELKENMNQVKIDMAKNNLLTEQLIETSKESSATMMCIRETMVVMAENMKQSNKEISANMVSLKDNVIKLEDKVDHKFDAVNSKIKEMDKEVEEINNEGKLNIRIWLRNSLPTIIIALAFAGYALSNFIK